VPVALLADDEFPVGGLLQDANWFVGGTERLLREDASFCLAMKFSHRDPVVNPKRSIWVYRGGAAMEVLRGIAAMSEWIEPTGESGWDIPMWIYRSKERFWDYTLNYDNYRVLQQHLDSL